MTHERVPVTGRQPPRSGALRACGTCTRIPRSRPFTNLRCETDWETFAWLDLLAAGTTRLKPSSHGWRKSLRQKSKSCAFSRGRGTVRCLNRNIHSLVPSTSDSA